MCSSNGSLVTTSIMDDHGVWINVENVIWATAVKLFFREKDPNCKQGIKPSIFMSLLSLVCICSCVCKN
jgi:hypothetical protein